MMSFPSCDFVIVGGGTAGLVVATRLSEDPSQRVLVLEAGADHIDDPRIKTLALYATLMKSNVDWGFESETQPRLNGRKIDLHQGKALGGSSAINAQVFVPPGKHSINAWEALGNAGWNWETLQSYYDKVYTAPKVTPGIDGWEAKGHDAKGPIQVSFPGNPAHPIRKAWTETFKNQGYHVSHDPWIDEPVGAFNCLVSVDSARKERSYVATAYYTPIKRRQNLHVLTEALVRRITLEKRDGVPTKATGVQYLHNGRQETVTANKEVILAAGALQSPKMLELSGLGNPEVLNKSGIPVFEDIPGVGENLQDHIICSMGFRAVDNLETLDPLVRNEPDAVKRAMQEHTTSQKGMFTSTGINTYAYMPLIAEHPVQDQRTLGSLLHRNQPSNNGPERVRAAGYQQMAEEALLDPERQSAVYLSVIGQRKVGGNALPGNWVTLAAILAHPLSRGSVHIRSGEISEAPIIESNYISDPVDIEVFTHHVMYLETIATSSPFSTLLEQPLHYQEATAKFNSSDDAREYIQSNTISMWHLAGTCAMLPRNNGGVVDTELKVHGVPNIRIVDSSTIPLITTGNLQSTVYALAERAADLIKINYRLA